MVCIIRRDSNNRAMTRYTQQPFPEELSRLLTERGMSIRALAREVDVSDAHLSKILRRQSYKTVSADLAERVAAALGLGVGYFKEAREGFVMDQIKADPELRDRLYRRLSRRR
jgi:transcriptional regulator with XRE-family HTH domain